MVASAASARGLTPPQSTPRRNRRGRRNQCPTRQPAPPQRDHAEQGGARSTRAAPTADAGEPPGNPLRGRRGASRREGAGANPASAAAPMGGCSCPRGWVDQRAGSRHSTAAHPRLAHLRAGGRTGAWWRATARGGTIFPPGEPACRASAGDEMLMRDACAAPTRYNFRSTQASNGAVARGAIAGFRTQVRRNQNPLHVDFFPLCKGPPTPSDPSTPLLMSF